MKHSFTDHVRKSVAIAREEALGLRHDYLGTEHLLLGVVRARDPEATRILAARGIDAGEVRTRVLSAVRPGKGTGSVHRTELPYTSRGKRVLELAMQVADERRTGQVGCVELLAGLMREEKGIAAVTLRAMGLAEEDLWEDGSDAPPRGSTPQGGSAAAGVAIDDASDRSIYEQIVGQIQERIAVGELEPGQRLPTVRRMADALDIAPGTVARAYGELERLGLVATEGARGTRVARRDPPDVPGSERAETLTGLLRPVAVAAFHLGATAGELRQALEEAMTDIFREDA